nr:hypothetical protein [uncultured bacterium]
MNPSQTLAPGYKAPPLSLLAMEPVRALFDFCASRLASQPEPIGDGHGGVSSFSVQ